MLEPSVSDAGRIGRRGTPLASGKCRQTLEADRLELGQRICRRNSFLHK